MGTIKFYVCMLYRWLSPLVNYTGKAYPAQCPDRAAPEQFPCNFLVADVTKKSLTFYEVATRMSQRCYVVTAPVEFSPNGTSYTFNWLGRGR